MMNILSFVISLLMIFAISTSTLLVKKKNQDIIAKSYNGYMTANRKSLNNYQSAVYTNIQAVKENDYKKNNTKKNEEPKRTIDLQNGKINIYPLLKEGIETHKDLYYLLSSLIKSLYSDKNFYKNNLENNIVNNMIKDAKKKFEDSDDINLAQLNMNNQDLQLNYYKMLKGSKLYNFENKSGVASLLDFICAYPTSEVKIPIIDTSKEILSLIFSKQIADLIEPLQIEEPTKTLTKDYVIDLCRKNNVKYDLTLFSFLNFSINTKNYKNKEIIGLDKDTNIFIKRKIYN